ncbi:hypothetical protein J6590_034375 [Homalodisca vitripennis]|nr:hypothetical protein J6590_034375 [Homalodisca vitripennis]
MASREVALMYGCIHQETLRAPVLRESLPQVLPRYRFLYPEPPLPLLQSDSLLLSQ